MLPRSRLLAVALVAVSVLMAGCLGLGDSGDEVDAAESDVVPDADVPGGVDVTGALSFDTHVVTPAVHFGHGLYEPTIDVSKSGVIYISSHTTGVDTTGAPAYYSADDGETWEQLPFAGPAQLPPPAQGGTPPPSDEIFIVAGDDGQAWGVDITLATFPVNGWCDDAAEHCYHNPDAYDEARAQTSRVDRATGADESCSFLNLNDRPWAAYENGKLLMVNNPGGGPVQVGAMDVPPPTYVDAWNPATGPEWNLCAGEGGGSIPGIPGMNEDHFFAVPQTKDGALHIVTGNAEDVTDVEQKKVFDNTHESVSAVGNYGQVVFDQEGKMFVRAMNNSGTEPGEDVGGLHLAVSTDDGETFTETTVRFDRPVASAYIDANPTGPGAVINWGLVEERDGRADWYLGHLRVDDEGKPVIEEASLAVEDGPPASRHVQGAAAGPDGRAYMVMSEVTANDDREMVGHAGDTPLSVVVQQEGPTLPLDVDTPVTD